MIDKEYTELYKKGISEPQPVLKPEDMIKGERMRESEVNSLIRKIHQKHCILCKKHEPEICKTCPISDILGELLDSVEGYNTKPIIFKERAEAFKKEVEQAAEKYNVKIDVGYISTCDDDQIIIEDKLPPNDRLYYDTLTDQERRRYL